MKLKAPTFFKSRAAKPGGPQARVHAVRRLDEGPAGDDTGRTWFAVELTADAGEAWWPIALEARGPEQPADEGAWGTVAAGRRRDGDFWRALDDEPLAGEHRVRVLLGLWPGAPDALVLVHGEVRLGALDVGRAARFPAEA